MDICSVHKILQWMILRKESKSSDKSQISLSKWEQFCTAIIELPQSHFISLHLKLADIFNFAKWLELPGEVFRLCPKDQCSSLHRNLHFQSYRELSWSNYIIKNWIFEIFPLLKVGKHKMKIVFVVCWFFSLSLLVCPHT